jgi:hypothetical protein
MVVKLEYPGNPGWGKIQKFYFGTVVIILQPVEDTLSRKTAQPEYHYRTVPIS